MNEPIFEKVLRKMRISKVLPEIKEYNNCKLLDIGCGWDAKFLKSIEKYISFGVGVDFKAPDIKSDKLKTINLTITDTLPFDNESFDVVTMLAVLEHLEYPLEILNEINRVLKKGGVLILTVPSVWSQPILEFLAFKLGVINKNEILDHKLYHNRLSIEFFARKSDFIVKKHKYFQFYMNNFAVLLKNENI